MLALETVAWDCVRCFAISSHKGVASYRHQKKHDQSGEKATAMRKMQIIFDHGLLCRAIFNYNGGGSTSVDNAIGSADGSAAGGASEIATRELRPAMMARPLPLFRAPSLSAD
jgi:hypothetical protein